MSELTIQIIGFAGLAFIVASYQIKSNKALFTLQMIGYALFILQLILLNALTGADSVLINLTRNILLMNVDKWAWVKRKTTMFAMLAILAVMTIATWNGPISLLPSASVFVTTIGYWTNNAQKIRLSQFIGGPFTIIYNILVRSWAGMLTTLISLISIIVSIVRFGWKNMGDAESEFQQ